MKLLFPLLILLLLSLNTQAQFEPQAGISGSLALHKSSASIVAWANACEVQRGYLNIADTALGKVSFGAATTAALGMADADVLSLGDSGQATVQFNGYIYNGPGPDFAVFENGFLNPTNPEEAYLELAFVEVSSDGEHFFRFPAVSLIQRDSQVAGVGQYINARQIHNLAGKYITSYGTTFDLDELKSLPGLDVDKVSHVRIVDVVGAINAHACLDANHNAINDPYPTPFPTGGFDLDAVAVMHLKPLSVPENLVYNSTVTLYPNPASNVLNIQFEQALQNESILEIRNSLGQRVMSQAVQMQQKINIETLAVGIYFVMIANENGKQCLGSFIKQ